MKGLAIELWCLFLLIVAGSLVGVSLIFRSFGEVFRWLEDVMMLAATPIIAAAEKHFPGGFTKKKP